jgi:GT2 family glycosyltransferase
MKGGDERFAAVVPTLGATDVGRCLAALAGQVPRPLIIAVAQGDVATAALRQADRVLSHPRPIGFARPVNLGIATTSARFVAVVNDDAVVEEHWAGILIAALEREPRAAAAQGVNLAPGTPPRIDGRGFRWNEHWQAVQIGYGELFPGPAPRTANPFGVSATAAIYRREALEAVRLATGFFDETLETFYEDVDLAIRLRAAGHDMLSVATARCLHLGGVTTRRQPARRWTLLHGNRRLVLRRLLGAEYRRALPAIDRRDVKDFLRALSRGDIARCRGVVAGHARDRRLAERFAHSGVPRVPLETLRHFGAPAAR